MFGKIVDQLLRRKPKVASKSPATLTVVFDHSGLVFSSNLEDEYWYFEPEKHARWEAVSVLGQWLESGSAQLTKNRTISVSWHDWYALTAASNPDYAGCENFFPIPKQSPLKLKLNAHGSFSDRDFRLIVEWELRGRQPYFEFDRVGGLLEQPETDLVHFNLGSAGGGFEAPKRYLLSAEYWRLLEAIEAFPVANSANSPSEQQLIFEKAWGKVRRLALLANVEMAPILRNYHVITADELDVKLVKHGEALDDIEIQPIVIGADRQQWLTSFDAHWYAQPTYTWTNEANELVKVVIDESALEVLNTIRKMPERRVKGELAERFLRNPAHVLGDAADQVFPTERFEKAKADAGVVFISFSCRLLRDKDTQDATGVRLDLMDDDFESDCVYEPIYLNSKAEVIEFKDKLSAAQQRQSIFLKWQGLSLALDDANHWLEVLNRWLTEERWAEDARIDLTAFYDLSKYYARIIGIGAHEPQSTPYIAKTEKGGWVPDILLGNNETGEIDRVTPEIVDAMQDWLKTNPTETDTFTHSDMPHIQKMSRKEVEATVKLHKGDKDIIASDPEVKAVAKPPKQLRQVLQIYQNIIEDEYAEWRDKIGKPTQSAKLPSRLRSQIKLKTHQLEGVAALQHLLSLRESKGVRGALMADDMGLGKTLQLLSFMIRYFEDHGKVCKPALVVAPVSLLENWRNEVSKFFDIPNSWLFSLYGDEISKQRNRLTSTERKAHQPNEEGKSLAPGKLLPPDWLHKEVRIVLTTYETLRDFEFPLGMIDWSIMVCDEAQKIKTPGALVTHAAKSMKADFRIACTGTPVENSLEDLRCLFDFIQPGLLPNQSEFHKTYRKPIENKTPEQKAKTEALRKLIDPQTIRRLKEQVAKDLPEKIEVNDCLALSLSDYQRGLYQGAVNWYVDQDNKKGAALAILHRLRGICAEPVPQHNNEVKVIEKSREEHLANSPKMGWLLEKLSHIHQLGEKAIIFTEFKDIQRILQKRIKDDFNCSAHIINGETEVAVAKGKTTRQQIINRFTQHQGFDVLILSPVAVGFGVNIQAANHVIHFTRTWNPAKEDQATDRAYRIGQEKTVYVYYPTVVSNEFETFEAKLHKLISAKRELGKDMLNGVGDITVSELAENMATPTGETILNHQRLLPEDLSSINAANFEKIVAEILRLQGFSTEVVGRAGDHGVDVWAVKEDIGYLVQCKSTSKASGLGIEGINEVVGGAAHYRAKDKKTQFKLAVATNGRFNQTAITHAKNQQESVELWDSATIERWLNEHHVYL